MTLRVVVRISAQGSRFPKTLVPTLRDSACYIPGIMYVQHGNTAPYRLLGCLYGISAECCAENNRLQQQQRGDILGNWKARTHLLYLNPAVEKRTIAPSITVIGQVVGVCGCPKLLYSPPLEIRVCMCYSCHRSTDRLADWWIC